MSNLSYHQPRVPLAPSRLLLRTLSGHKSYVTSVSFFGPQCDRLITGSYDEVAKVRLSCCVGSLRGEVERRLLRVVYTSTHPHVWREPSGCLLHHTQPNSKAAANHAPDTPVSKPWYLVPQKCCCRRYSPATQQHTAKHRYDDKSAACAAAPI